MIFEQAWTPFQSLHRFFLHMMIAFEQWLVVDRGARRDFTQSCQTGFFLPDWPTTAHQASLLPTSTTSSCSPAACGHQSPCLSSPISPSSSSCWCPTSCRPDLRIVRSSGTVRRDRPRILTAQFSGNATMNKVLILRSATPSLAIVKRLSLTTRFLGKAMPTTRFSVKIRLNWNRGATVLIQSTKLTHSKMTEG